MEALSGRHLFPPTDLSPIRPPKTMSTPQTVSPSSAGSLPSMMDESVLYRCDRIDDSDSDDVSISLDELMSLTNDPAFRTSSFNKDQSTHADQSSTACLGSPNSSRDTLDTTAAIAISPHKLAERFLKAQQKQARRTQSMKIHSNVSPTLEDYLQKTRSRETATSLNESNGTLFGGMKRSQSENSLPFMENESVSGRKFVRRRSNSFDQQSPHKQENDKLFQEITLMRLEASATKKHGASSKLALRSDSTEDGCNDEDVKIRRARGRHLSRQQSVRDATAGRAKRDKEIRRGMLRKECSVHQLKKADDFLQASDAESLKELVDSWREEKNNEVSGSLGWHKTASKRQKSRRRKTRDPSGRRPQAFSGIITESNEPSISEESRGLVSTSNETSETSILSTGSDVINSLHQAVLVEELKERLDPNLSPIKISDDELGKEQSAALKADSDTEEGQDSMSTPLNVSREASETSIISDTSDMIVTPYQFGLREDLNVHRYSDPFVSSVLKKRNCELEWRYPSVNGASSYSDDEDAGVIVQFDAKQEDHISRVRLDITDGRLLRIDCWDGPIMEGIICRMPAEDVEDSAVQDSEIDSGLEIISSLVDANPTPNTPRPQMLWKGPSKFFSRRQKSSLKQDTSSRNRQDDEPRLFDEFGRLIEDNLTR